MSKNDSKTTLELKEKNLTSEEAIPFETNEKKNNYKLKKIVIKNRGHSEFGRQLTYNKKLEKELDSLPDNVSKFFRKSLDEYKFNLEVYVPHSMVISKKEYFDKNYMLNNLVRIEDIIKTKKKQISHISKETKKFSHQYEIVREENLPHRLEYLSKIENMYKNKGYKTSSISYKKDENIFNPSFLLDSKYGNNSKTDAVKYGQNNYKKEYKLDKGLLRKFDDFINKKSQSQKKNEPTFEDDEEKLNFITQIKKNLNEQIKIQNMTQKEYFSYSNKIKKEIESINNAINNLDDLNANYKKKIISHKIISNKSLSETKNKKDTKNNEFNINSQKRKKKLVDFNSNIFLSSKGMKDYSKDKIKNLTEIKDYTNNKKGINNNKAIIQKKKIEIKNIIIPKLRIKKVLNKNENIEKEPIYLSKRELKEIQKERQLTQIYDKLYNKKKYSAFPSKLINQYFTNYTLRKYPLTNTDRGSNLHGLVEEVQNKINENNFSIFARLNNNLKSNMNFNYKNEDNHNKKVVDEDYINELDNKILKMHYDLTDKLLSNKNDQINNF